MQYLVYDIALKNQIETFNPSDSSILIGSKVYSSEKELYALPINVLNDQRYANKYHILSTLSIMQLSIQDFKPPFFSINF